VLLLLLLLLLLFLLKEVLLVLVLLSLVCVLKSSLKRHVVVRGDEGTHQLGSSSFRDNPATGRCCSCGTQSLTQHQDDVGKGVREDSKAPANGRRSMLGVLRGGWVVVFRLSYWNEQPKRFSTPLLLLLLLCWSTCTLQEHRKSSPRLLQR
jgi:hypothetical protein